MLVEIKMTARREDPIEGREGRKSVPLRDIEERNGDRVVYRIVFSDAQMPSGDVAATELLIRGGDVSPTR